MTVGSTHYPTKEAVDVTWINQAAREVQDGETADAIPIGCPTGDHEQCVFGLTAGGVINGTAVSACRMASQQAAGAVGSR
ncbi:MULTISPECIES: hypothetical protein [unclassified Streptomyces]|uniref:hypothetical protein n=1 Tax=unclassified Streptomyces TaxID=2593676 RepID=UPI0037F8647B